MKKIDCLRCGQKMRYFGTEKLQFGQTSWIFGDLPNLLAGAMEVDVYCCSECRKLEFFLAEENEMEEESDVDFCVEEDPTFEEHVETLCGILFLIWFARTAFASHHLDFIAKFVE